MKQRLTLRGSLAILTLATLFISPVRAEDTSEESTSPETMSVGENDPDVSAQQNDSSPQDDSAIAENTAVSEDPPSIVTISASDDPSSNEGIEPINSSENIDPVAESGEDLPEIAYMSGAGGPEVQRTDEPGLYEMGDASRVVPQQRGGENQVCLKRHQNLGLCK